MIFFWAKAKVKQNDQKVTQIFDLLGRIFFRAHVTNSLLHLLDLAGLGSLGQTFGRTFGQIFCVRGLREVECQQQKDRSSEEIRVFHFFCSGRNRMTKIMKGSFDRRWTRVIEREREKERERERECGCVWECACAWVCVWEREIEAKKLLEKGATCWKDINCNSAEMKGRKKGM